MGRLTKQQIATDLYLYFNLMVEARRKGKVLFKVLFEDVCKKNEVECSEELFDEVLNVSVSTNLINALGLLKDIFIDSFDNVDQNFSQLDFLVDCLSGDETEKNYWDSKRVSIIREIRNAICHSDQTENYTMNSDGTLDVNTVTRAGEQLNVHLTQSDLYKICVFLTNNSKRNRIWRFVSPTDGTDVDLSKFINDGEDAFIAKLRGIKIVRLQANIDSTRREMFDNGPTLDIERPEVFIDSYLGTNVSRQENCFSLTFEQCEDLAKQISLFKSGFGDSFHVFANALLYSNLEFPDWKVERMFYEAFKLKFISGDDTYCGFINSLREDYFDFLVKNGKSKIFSRCIRSTKVEPKLHFVMLYEDYERYPYNDLTNYLNYVYSNFSFDGMILDETKRHFRNAFMHRRFSYLKATNASDDIFVPYICLFDNRNDVTRPRSLDNARWSDVISCSEAIALANQAVQRSMQHQSSNVQK